VNAEIQKLIAKLKKEKYQIIAVEQDENSVDYKKVKLSSNAAIIYGNEVEGVPKNLLKLCDVIAEIPMQGAKESLNVSVSVGVSLFRMLNL
jgi:tRNA G18 (ribose-2'-O)-methylase SpoU